MITTILGWICVLSLIGFGTLSILTLLEKHEPDEHENESIG